MRKQTPIVAYLTAEYAENEANIKALYGELPRWLPECVFHAMVNGVSTGS